LVFFGPSVCNGKKKEMCRKKKSSDKKKKIYKRIIEKTYKTRIHFEER